MKKIRDLNKRKNSRYKVNNWEEKKVTGGLLKGFIKLVLANGNN